MSRTSLVRHETVVVPLSWLPAGLIQRLAHSDVNLISYLTDNGLHDNPDRGSKPVWLSLFQTRCEKYLLADGYTWLLHHSHRKLLRVDKLSLSFPILVPQLSARFHAAQAW